MRREVVFARTAKVGLFILLISSALGCKPKPSGGPDGGGEDVAPVRQAVGPSGGSVKTSDGSGVTIPAGALGSEVTVTVTPTPLAPTPSGSTAVGAPFVLGPEGQQFSSPVTVTLSFDPAKLPSGFTANDVVIMTAAAGSTDFTALSGSRVDGTHVSATTTHFSVFVPTVASQSGGCGPCGPACPTGQVCDNGHCAQTCRRSASAGCDPLKGGCSGCSTAKTLCGQVCVDVSADDSNCGACGTVCGAGKTCAQGSCVATCPSGEVCSPSGVCVSGCPNGGKVCGAVASNATGQCVDVSSDPANCGACGNACAAGALCEGGQCRHNCTSFGGGGCDGSPQADGGVDCGACGTASMPCPPYSCVDPSSDKYSCGSCGNVCGDGQLCSGGVCTTVCAASEVCSLKGACVGSCPNGGRVCGTVASNTTGRCVDVSSDRSNCGACGHACAAGETCEGGTCRTSCTPLPTAGCDALGGSCSQCGAASTLCGAVCVDATSDRNNCGGCGKTCGNGQACSGGACVPMCPSGQVCSPQGACVTACPAGTQVCGTVDAGATGTCVGP